MTKRRNWPALAAKGRKAGPQEGKSKKDLLEEEAKNWAPCTACNGTGLGCCDSPDCPVPVCDYCGGTGEEP